MQAWAVEFHGDFVPEFRALPYDVRRHLLATLENLKTFGPELGRPEIDRLEVGGKVKHKNLKEIRFRVNDQVWRFAFAFDPRRHAIVLCGGAKGGTSESRFYRKLIAVALQRYNAHIMEMKNDQDR